MSGQPAGEGMLLWELSESFIQGANMTRFMNWLRERYGLDFTGYHDISSLKVVGSTGYPLSVEGFKWVYDAVKRDVWLGSVSGGTDPCSPFLGCSPLLPVHAVELQCRCLGVKADAFDEQGRSVVNQVGELVITER